jgi:riboflavin kinase
MHKFPHDFYGCHLRVLILGFLRPEFDFPDSEALKEAIRLDIEASRQSLARPIYERYRADPYLRNFQQHSKPQHDV